ncbi:MAG TPA: HupE/UreJ family protein, partial [Blastocatellia bacterium]|nr:HupE/UreJ family protein [Blastocatellia bacterium]
RIVRRRVIAALAAALILATQLPTTAHDIPNDVTVQAFLKPQGQRLQLLVRVPLRACRDVDFPTRGPGYLDLARADASLRDAATLWISDNVELYEGDTRLSAPRVIAARVSLESERFFESYDDALAHVTGARLPSETELYWNQGLLDVLFEYPINSDDSYFSIRPRLAALGLRVVTVLRFVPPGGAVRAFEFDGDPGLVRLDPRWHQAALRFVEAGFFHILDGTDHLLFLFCLVIPFRRFRPLITVVTAFTIAHSVTLIASAYNLGPDALWFPPLIETLIAVSIVYMALENIVGSNVKRRWMVALGFGLVHGFGFSFALRQNLQFAGSHLLTSLLSFNVGVELGQLFVLLLLIPVLAILFRFVVAERIGTIILSALVAHTGWHWMIDRGERLKQFGWPAISTAQLVSVMRWLIVILILAGLVWLAFAVRYWAQRGPERKAARMR